MHTKELKIGKQFMKMVYTVHTFEIHVDKNTSTTCHKNNIYFFYFFAVFHKTDSMADTCVLYMLLIYGLTLFLIPLARAQMSEN